MRLQLISFATKKELLSLLFSIKLVLIRSMCYQCKLVCRGVESRTWDGASSNMTDFRFCELQDSLHEENAAVLFEI